MWMVVLAICIILVLVIFAKRLSPESVKVDGKHVVVTGGSSGIGKTISILAAQQGANVTILARNKLKLEEAKTEIQQHLKSDRKVQCISVDLAAEYAPVEKAIRDAEEKLGPVFMLVNSAGSPLCREFLDLKPDDFKTLMAMNYYSAVFTTKAVLPSMVQQKGGRVVLLSSQAGQIGIYGFTAYSSAKFALRGFAESLQMEMTPHNVRVTVAFPPDTDTPGYQQELEGKPKETILISESSGLHKVEDISSIIFSDSLNGKFTSYQGLDGWMLANGSAGMCPATSLSEIITQFFLNGLLRVVGLCYLASFDSIILKCKKEKEASKIKSS